MGGAKHLKFNRTVLLRLIHIINHIAFIYGLYWYSPWWLGLTVVCWFFYGCFGISIGFHRLLSHRSFEPTNFSLKMTTLLGCLATGGRPITWVGAHRLHHAFSDRAGDPHSIKVHSWWRVYFHAWKPFIMHGSHL